MITRQKVQIRNLKLSLWLFCSLLSLCLTPFRIPKVLRLSLEFHHVAEYKSLQTSSLQESRLLYKNLQSVTYVHQGVNGKALPASPKTCYVESASTLLLLNE